MGSVINLDIVRDLRDVPGKPGYRIDQDGREWYSSRWLDGGATATVGELPAPEVPERYDGPADPAGAAMVKRQAATAPKDGWIGPRRLLNGLLPTRDDQLDHAAGLLVASLRGAARAAEALARVGGPRSPVEAQATALGRELLTRAATLERELGVGGTRPPGPSILGRRR